MMYAAFGLRISSDIALPPLPPACSDEGKADIVIRRGVVDRHGLAALEVVTHNCQITENKLWLHVPGIAWFYVTDGNRVCVELEVGADEQSVRLFLLGTCMGALMHQRSRLVIHGNAIRVGNECVVFAGASGKGKSTVATAFYQRGYSLLSDDLAVVDEHHLVQPAYPQIKIWQDTADRAGIDTAKLQRIRLQLDKYAYPVQPENFCNTPLPLRALYILSTHNEDTIKFSPITGADKFIRLKNQTYRNSHLEGLGLKAHHLRSCANLANKIPITRITRPINGCELKRLIALIEADLHKDTCAA